MSRMSQVIQIGEIEGNIHYYIEDYAYTYLKKQEGKEKTKYFLYGEKEECEQKNNLYIYGIAEKPKMEQSYFKEYYPLGYLQIKDSEKYWVTLKGQEQKITGFYIFYASNQAMQEYLVDHRDEVKEDKIEHRVKRQQVQESLPLKKVVMPARKYKVRKKKKENLKDNFIYSFVGIALAVMVVFLLTSTNGKKKIEIFKQVIAETMADTVKETADYNIIIEEKSITEQDNTEEIAEITEIQEIQEEISKPQGEELQQEENIYEEYVVKEGDTLAAICKNKYGTLSNIQEICNINNIENADYIEPGQKIYLPR